MTAFLYITANFSIWRTKLSLKRPLSTIQSESHAIFRKRPFQSLIIRYNCRNCHLWLPERRVLVIELISKRSLENVDCATRLNIVDQTVVLFKEARAGCGLQKRLREFFFYFCICNIHGIPSISMCKTPYLTVIVVKRRRSQNTCPM